LARRNGGTLLPAAAGGGARAGLATPALNRHDRRSRHRIQERYAMISPMAAALEREAVPEPQNPLGMDGIEVIEFATWKPQALGAVLETMGFRPVARHRSREVELYRQGSMNVVVNAQAADVPRTVQPVERPIISAFAMRVHDAEAAFRRALDLGA